MGFHRSDYVGKPVIEIKWLVLAVVLALAATSFRGVAIDFRKVAWFGSQNLTQSERLGLMLKLLQVRAERDGIPATILHGIAETGGRSANLDLLTDVVRKTPDPVPYWGGVTYLSLVGFAVPRVLWPNKPSKTLGQDFGHRYGYLDPHDSYTSINFPFLIEFYANFGESGVLIGMLIVGVLYRVLDSLLNRPGQPLKVTVCALVLMVPLLNIESDFSLVFGGLFMNGVALALLFRALERTYFARPVRAPLPGGPPQTEQPA